MQRRVLAETMIKALCRCLELLGEEAKPFAVDNIHHWTEIDVRLLTRCFQVAGGTEEVCKAANEMLTAWDHLNSRFRILALRAPFDTPLRIQHAREVLENWQKQYRPRLLNLSETVPALFSTSAPFSKALKVTCIGGKSWMKVA